MSDQPKPILTFDVCGPCPLTIQAHYYELDEGYLHFYRDSGDDDVDDDTCATFAPDKWSAVILKTLPL